MKHVGNLVLRGVSGHDIGHVWQLPTGEKAVLKAFASDVQGEQTSEIYEVVNAPVIVPDPASAEVDFILKGGPGTYAWITVGNISVHLKHCDEGVAVTFYPRGRETDESIGESWVLFSEASTEEE